MYDFRYLQQLQFLLKNAAYNAQLRRASAVAHVDLEIDILTAWNEQCNFYENPHSPYVKKECEAVIRYVMH
jgi:hypothetical protein